MSEGNTALSILDTVDLQQVSSAMASISKFQQIVNQTLKSGCDYDVIPGTQKPTLLKPGAEKILMLLGLTSEYQVTEQVEDYSKGIFAYTVKCTLSRGGSKITEGLGSCNSKEDKYRWRWVKESDLPEGVSKDNLKKRTTGYGQVQYRVENDEIYSQINTVLKMAKKRAQIDATLTVAALSEAFTQDIEDMKQFVQAEEIENMKPDEVGNVKVNFGKYKGQTLDDIAKEDIGYIQWLADKARDQAMRKAAGMVLNGDQAPRKDVDVKQKAQKVDPKPDQQAEQTGFAELDDDVELPF